MSTGEWWRVERLSESDAGASRTTRDRHSRMASRRVQASSPWVEDRISNADNMSLPQRSSACDLRLLTRAMNGLGKKDQNPG